MIICVLAYRVDSLTYTIVKALTYGGHEIFLQVMAQEHICDLDSGLLKELDSVPKVIVNTTSVTETPDRFDLLIVQGHPKILEHHSMLDELCRRANKLSIISVGDRKLLYRQAMMKQWQELRWYGRKLLHADRVVYKDGFYPIDLFGLFLPRRVTGFDVHSKFLKDAYAYRLIHTTDWVSNDRRPILANFLGCRDPVRRARIVDSVRQYFFENDGKSQKQISGKRMYWHEYSDAHPSALELTEYLDILTESDFTLCPPGYSLVTHRPVEAMLRGSIPVLNSNELDLYDIGLEDGLNCVIADPEDWPSAMDRLFEMDPERIIAMRQNIYGIIPDILDYSASSRRMRERLGVDE